MKNFINNLTKHHQSLRALTFVEVKTSVAATKIGMFWWILDPLIMMLIYYFVISVVFGRGGPGYHLFVLCGIICWRFFSQAVTGCTNSIMSQKNLILQINVPHDILVLTQPIVKMFFAIFGVLIIVVWNFNMVGLHTLAVIPLLLLIMFLAYGLGLFLAVLNVYVNDVGRIVVYALRMGFFLSPVLFPATRIMESEKIPEIFKLAYGLNPVAWIITSMRTVLIEGRMYAVGEACIVFVASILLVQVGLMYLRRNSPRIVKWL